jgi:hypothetical protein
MTTSSLAKKVRRLEILANRPWRRGDATVNSEQVVLPPGDEFRALPLAEQIRLLSAWRPPPGKVKLPPVDEFGQLPVAERIRLMNEAKGPPDPAFSACFRCLPLSEAIKLCRGPGR